MALVDCNSFYASCEQVFRADLQGKPVVVLSNNDGCIIAANKEAKQIADIPMFQPVFKIKDLLKAHQVTMFSSNYTLYGEMSQRVINVLRNFSPHLEAYSIDESFLDLSGLSHKDLSAYGKEIKEKVLKHTGLPVGVGIASTKVLSKVANKLAKKIPENEGVFVIDSEAKRIEALQKTLIADVWGIGRKHVKRLQNIGIYTANHFTELPLNWVRKNMTVVGERMWRELRGEKMMEVTNHSQPRKAVATAKSFGKKLEKLDIIEEACAYYISEVSEILRKQNSTASYLQVFLNTNYHSDFDKQYHPSITVKLEMPTNNTFVLIKEANKILRKIYKPGFRYKKVGVCLSGLRSENYVQTNLFCQEFSGKQQNLMQMMDDMNAKYGKSTIFSSSLGIRKKEWELIKEERSPRYTTQWKELLKVQG
ncbi:Y-family DNA polymerase [Mesonia sp. K7]|uniref:Y-family DNA polymerase n=1 Tax=Mesonia sp. K7 TaxID=2218606 RepID=UPI001F1D44D9|nr:Y-family DNA polymerase [Mesonia sp. K7]